MKFCALFTTAMMASSVSAFAPSAGKVSSSTALQQSIDYNPGAGGFSPNSALSNDPVDATLMNMVRFMNLLSNVLFYSVQQQSEL